MFGPFKGDHVWPDTMLSDHAGIPGARRKRA